MFFQDNSVDTLKSVHTLLSPSPRDKAVLAWSNIEPVHVGTVFTPVAIAVVAGPSQKAHSGESFERKP